LTGTGDDGCGSAGRIDLPDADTDIKVIEVAGLVDREVAWIEESCAGGRSAATGRSLYTELAGVDGDDLRDCIYAVDDLFWTVSDVNVASGVNFSIGGWAAVPACIGLVGASRSAEAARERGISDNGSDKAGGKGEDSAGGGAAEREGIAIWFSALDVSDH